MLNYVQLNANCVCLQIGLQVASIVFNPGDDDGKKWCDFKRCGPLNQKQSTERCYNAL